MLREAGSRPAEVEASVSWRALGTLVQLVVTDPRCLPEARRLLSAELDAVDAACSRFRPDSEICSLRTILDRTAPGRPVQVSPLLAEAIAVALRAARLTDGDVDPTVGGAMSAVGYDCDFDRVPRTGPPLPVPASTVPAEHGAGQHGVGRCGDGPDRARLACGPSGGPAAGHAARGPA